MGTKGALLDRSEGSPRPQPQESVLADTLGFAWRHRKLLGLTALGVCSLAVVLVPLRPRTYQKQLTLVLMPAPTGLPDAPSLDLVVVGSMAVERLQRSGEERATVTAKYDPGTRQLRVTLRSSDLASVARAAARLRERLQQGLQEAVGKAITDSLTSIRFRLERDRRVLTELERQISQCPPRQSVRLEELETLRAQKIVEIASREFDREYFETASRNSAGSVGVFLSAQVLTETDVRETSSRLPVLALAAMAGLMTAFVVVIVREGIAARREPASR